MTPLRSIALAAALCGPLATQAAPMITGTANANALAAAIVGTGITVSNATFNASGPASLPHAAGTFTNGSSTVGFGSGIVLTNGTIACATGANTETNCGQNREGNRDTTSLKFDFSSDTGMVFFRYVLGSEEYTEFAPSPSSGLIYNDGFELLLNGVNIAKLPATSSGSDLVETENINCLVNSSYYRNNDPFKTPGNNPASCLFLNLDIQYDGLTTVLTASGTVSSSVTNTFEFRIFDRGDNVFDSGVFIEAGSFASTNTGNVPEPGSWALAALALVGLGAVRRKA